MDEFLVIPSAVASLRSVAQQLLEAKGYAKRAAMDTYGTHNANAVLIDPEDIRIMSIYIYIISYI